MVDKTGRFISVLYVYGTLYQIVGCRDRLVQCVYGLLCCVVLRLVKDFLLLHVVHVRWCILVAGYRWRACGSVFPAGFFFRV